eukprot:2413294-Ditylum_brightwellii.AAC.1
MHPFLAYNQHRVLLFHVTKVSKEEEDRMEKEKEEDNQNGSDVVSIFGVEKKKKQYFAKWCTCLLQGVITLMISSLDGQWQFMCPIYYTHGHFETITLAKRCQEGTVNYYGSIQDIAQPKRRAQ